ncbi:hypothetical protein J4233_01900 [Candidatus Pacearchaeota archaeon]|nr:hypothetical protein [Candidatus Pacearchaeota archaeon]
MKKLIFPVFLFLGITMLLSVVSAEIFHIDDRFKVGWTDGTDNYEAEYKVWKIEEQSGQNITILVHASTGSIAIHSLNGLTTSLGASSKLIINQIYVSGDDRWISISLQNAQFKESTTAPTSPSSGGGGGGGTTNNTGGGGQGGGCYDTDGGKDYYEKGIAAGVYDSCISKYQLSERYCTNSQGADYIVDCPIGYLCSEGACVQSDNDDRQENTTSTTTYFKNCNYVWDSSPYVGQTIKITASVKDSSGSVDSDSVEVNVLGSVLGGSGGAYPMDGKTLDIQIIEPGAGDVAGAVQIKINSKGPKELGEMSLGLSGSNWGAGFPISNRNCVAGGSGGGGSGGGTSCEKYHICEDGSEVQYCEIIKQYDNNGNVVSAGCACKQNPEELCTSPSSGGGGGSGGQPIIINSSSGGGGGGGSVGSNETPIICNGCILGNKCAPVGYRQEGKYCTINSEFISQLNADVGCDNNFECSTNLCIDNKCVSSGLWQKFIRWFSRIFGGN